MRGWRVWAVGATALAATLVVLVGLLQFLAPDVSYQVRDRIAETFSGQRGRTFRIALGARLGHGRVAADSRSVATVPPLERADRASSRVLITPRIPRKDLSELFYSIEPSKSAADRDQDRYRDPDRVGAEDSP